MKTDFPEGTEREHGQRKGDYNAEYCLTWDNTKSEETADDCEGSMALTYRNCPGKLAHGGYLVIGRTPILN